MTRLKICLASIALLIVTSVNAQNNQHAVLRQFQNISGAWKGSLTYLDYSTGKPYTMPANIIVKRIDKTNKFTVANIYPNETSANATDTVTISKNGKYIDRELVIASKTLPTGEVEIITEEKGKDGNDEKPATFRYTYTFGKTTFKKRKDVQFVGEKEWINRHEYTYVKEPGR